MEVGVSLHIRKMKFEDITQVQHIAKISWHATYDGIIPLHVQTNFLRVAYHEEMLERRMHQSYMIVCEIDGEIIGFANFSLVNKAKEVELAAIYLDPLHQGKGVGTALLQAGLNHLSPVNKVYLNVEKENKIGRQFYEAKGFKLVKEFDDHFDGHVLKTVRMVLDVTSVRNNHPTLQL